MKRWTWWSKYNYLWITGSLFLAAFIGHWVFSWWAYVQEQTSLGLPVAFNEYLVLATRDTFENWQSEFLQLIWQIAGLAFLFSVGSPQSKEGDERKEEKIDRIIELLDEENGKKFIKRLEEKYPKR